MKIIVYHDEYGCDTGCCGHVVEVEDAPPGFRKPTNWTFDHPYGAKNDEAKLREWAENLVREEFGEEHVADLDWDNCRVLDD